MPVLALGKQEDLKLKTSTCFIVETGSSFLTRNAKLDSCILKPQRSTMWPTATVPMANIPQLELHLASTGKPCKIMPVIADLLLYEKQRDIKSRPQHDPLYKFRHMD
jgi:hypothetical protein